MIEIRLTVREPVSLSEALKADAIVEIKSDASATTTDLERMIGRRIEDSFEQILKDVATIIKGEGPQCPHCLSRNTFEVARSKSKPDDGKTCFQCAQCCRYFGVPNRPAIEAPSIDV